MNYQTIFLYDSSLVSTNTPCICFDLSLLSLYVLFPPDNYSMDSFLFFPAGNHKKRQ